MTEQKQNRASREVDSRAESNRPIMWRPPETLPSVKPHDGWTPRWVRTMTGGQYDGQNISSKMREGYEPCKAVDYPDLMMHESTEGRFKGGIEVGGLLLCRIPTEILKQREAYYASQNRAQMEAVDNNFMRDNDPRISKFSEKSTKVTFGTGS